jgi:gluconate 2-dehydrogenase gamma chain
MTDEELHARLVARRVSRRRLLAGGATTGLTTAVVVGSAALAGALPSQANQLSADSASLLAQAQPQPTSQPQTAAQAKLAGFVYFNPFQAAIVAAAAARLIPTDANGPGATEAGVVYFIDRQLSADYGLSGRRYDQGPYQNGTSTQGDQSGLLMRDRYRQGIAGIEAYAQQVYQRGFASLAVDQHDRILRDMELGIPGTFDGTSIQAATTESAASGTEGGMRQATPGGAGVGARAFFNLLLSHTIAGFFADPVYGGNRDMVGWKLIGFPGAQMSYAANISRYGQPFEGLSKSLADYQGQYSV